ncbi:hypothetical protein QO009_003619 [Brevibacillus aydinogluensis]|nr:hypothetical protein [Brevibacillus aydinogluensis]
MKTRDTSLDPRKLSIPKVISVDIYLSIKRFYRLQIPIPSSLHPSYQAPLYRSILCEKTPKPPELPLQIHRSINFRGIGNIDQQHISLYHECDKKKQYITETTKIN